LNDSLGAFAPLREHILSNCTSASERELTCGALLRAGAVAVLFFVSGDAFCEGISMDSEDDGRVRQVLFVLSQGLLYIELLKLANGFVQEDVTLQHLVD